MFDGGFDGIDVVVQIVPDASPLISLYSDILDFEAVVDDDPPSGIAELLGAPGRISRIVRLSRGADVGGAILLAEAADAPPPAKEVVGPVSRGVYALDFYVRDAAAIEKALAEAGWSFTSPPVRYDLPGTTIPVRERMLIQPYSGLLHALVEHRPNGTRSILSSSPEGHVSETVAVVILTSDLPSARAFASAVLGGHEYYHDVFAGAALEEMLELAPGAGLEAALYRGPTSRNARLEFACPVGADGLPSPLGPEYSRRILAGLLVNDLDRLVDRLGVGGHGDVGATGELAWAGETRRAVRFDTRYDLGLLLIDHRIA